MAQVLSQHSQVLNRGLMVEIQTINNILNGDIPVVTTSSEQVFLTDFMESKGETPGGRLARWLQPDRAVDLDASELTLPTEPVKVGVSSEFSLCTKDQDGKSVFVDGMKVHNHVTSFVLESLTCYDFATDVHVCSFHQLITKCLYIMRLLNIFPRLRSRLCGWVRRRKERGCRCRRARWTE